MNSTASAPPTASAATPPHLAYLALGSNLGEPVVQLCRAVRAIAELPQTVLLSKSSLYRSPPWPQPSDQADYCNAVLAIATSLAPDELLRQTSRLEQLQGRVRSERNAARTLDIDLLLYDDVVNESATLTLPHPRMHERAFVLCPLLEIAPDIVIPRRGEAAILRSRISTDGLTKIGNNDAWNSMSCAM